MAKKNNETNRGGFFTSGPQDSKQLPKRNPYPTVNETGKQRFSHGYTQSQIVGLQGTGVDLQQPRLYPDFTACQPRSPMQSRNLDRHQGATGAH